MNNYLFFTVARSGKSWIAETLYWLGLGYGLELLTEFARGAAPDQDLLQAAYRRKGMAGLASTYMETDRKKGYPCSGVTLQWTNMSSIADGEKVAELAAFIDALQPCKLFFLRRKDVLAQAISHYIMMKTGYSHSTSPGHLRSKRSQISYNRDEIKKYIEFTEQSYEGWEGIFCKLNINPNIIYYEDFMNDPAENFLELSYLISETSYSVESITGAMSCQEKLSDSIDDDFISRFKDGY